MTEETTIEEMEIALEAAKILKKMEKYTADFMECVVKLNNKGTSISDWIVCLDVDVHERKELEYLEVLEKVSDVLLVFEEMALLAEKHKS